MVDTRLTLHQHLSRHSVKSQLIFNQSTSQSTLGRLSTDCWSSVDGVQTKMLIEYWLRCRSRHWSRTLTVDAFSTHDLIFLSSVHFSAYNLVAYCQEYLKQNNMAKDKCRNAKSKQMLIAFYPQVKTSGSDPVTVIDPCSCSVNSRCCLWLGWCPPQSI